MNYYHVRLINIDAKRAEDERFRTKFTLIQEQLNAPGRIDHTSMHEAAHLVYFRRAGIDARMFGPAIEYTGKEFISCLAAIGNPTINEFTAYTPELLTDLARAGIAANLFDDEFLKQLENSDSSLAQIIRAEKALVCENDYSKFKQCCNWAMRQGMSYEPQKYWREAKESVTAELADQSLRNEIRCATEEVRKDCFRELSLTT